MADTNSTYYQPPKPSPVLKRLGFFAGEWEVAGLIRENQFGPEGKIKGRHSWKLMKGGFFWVHHWNQELGIGVEYIGWDEPNKRLHTHYFDNNGPYDEAGSTYEGEFREDSLVFCGPARLTYTSSADGKTIKFTAEATKKQQSQGLNAPDSEWEPMLEATFTKLD